MYRSTLEQVLIEPLSQSVDHRLLIIDFVCMITICERHSIAFTVGTVVSSHPEKHATRSPVGYACLDRLEMPPPAVLLQQLPVCSWVPRTQAGIVFDWEHRVQSSPWVAGPAEPVPAESLPAEPFEMHVRPLPVEPVEIEKSQLPWLSEWLPAS